MKVGIKLSDSYKKSKRGSHAACRIRGHWLADRWDELDDIFYPEYFNQTNGEFFKLENQLEKLKGYDAVILHKAYEWELASELRKRGQKVIVDLADPDYLLGFSDVHRAGLCLMTLNNADACVINSREMLNDLKVYDRPIFVITDRVDVTKFRDFKTVHRDKIQELVWFGYSGNKDSLLSIADQFKDYKIKIITDQPFGEFEFVKWDLETFNQEAVKADACIIGKKLHKYKLNNREMTATALKIPIVNSKEELEAIQDKDKRIQKVNEAYEILLRDYEMSRSVKEWKQVLKTIV